MEERRLAFVLGGGGARGALQVGALRAMIEAGMQPDLLVGTSVGAMNAACLALHGINPKGIAELEQAWQDASQSCLLNLQPFLAHPACLARPPRYSRHYEFARFLPHPRRNL